MSELCNEKDDHTSSDDSTPPTSISQCPSTPSPKRKKKSATSYRRHKHGRQLKKNKGKWKRVSSSSSASSSGSCASTDPDSRDLEIIGKTTKKSGKIPKKGKRHWQSKFLTSTPKENRMCGIFQAHYSNLVTRISSCLLTVANELFSKKMISNEVQSQILANQGTEQEKASKLLFHVKKIIDGTPSKLTDFIEVLEREPTCDDIVAEIMSEIKDFNRMAVKKETARLPSKPRSSQHSLVQYKAYLHSYYENDPIARDDKLGIAPSSEFINFALVRHDEFTYMHGASFSGNTEEESLGLDSIVTPDSRFVLVEGDAGMGKSTLCWELCRKWDDLKSLQHYEIVVLQKLREKRLQKATTLNEIFHHDNPALSKGVVDEMYRCEGEGVLLILDGFDEMPAKVIRNKESLIMRVISGACLPKATRLVTSRPSAIQYRKRDFPQEYRHVKTLGFTNESIEQFAEKALAINNDILEHFKKFILSNPIIKSMMYTPVNCAILAQVYKDIMKSSELMPKTMTQLYTTLVLVLIRRHMIEKGEWDHDLRIPCDLNGLPDDVTAALKRISELAYSGLFKEEVQLVFSDDEVGECFEHLGLLSEAKEMYVSEGARSTFSFPHKSIQEFLAACCVAHFSDMISIPAPHEEKLDKLFLGYSQYKTFALFLCGMFGCNAGASLMWRKIYSSSNFRWGMGYFCLCLYESQDLDNFSFLMEESSINFTSYSVRLSTPLDAYALGYCVARLPLQFVIEYIHTSLEPLLSSLHDHMHTGIFPGSIKYLEVANVDILYPHRSTVQEVAKLIEIFNKKGKPISGICLRLTSVVRDIQWLTELIPALHLVTELSLDLFLQRPLEHDYLVYHQLLNLDLKKFSLKCPGCTKRGAQELHSVISTSTSLEEVTLKYSMAVVSDFCSLLYPPSCVDPFASYSVVGAVMSSPTVKRLVTNFAFTVSRNRNIQHIIFEIDYECVYPTAAYLFALCLDIRRILMSLWYCIEVKHDIGSFLPPESITLRINTDVLDNFYPTCNFVAILNKYLLLCDKPTQVIVQSVTCCSQKITSYSSVERSILPQVSSFSRALRREPYLSSCTLKKAQSLEDLNQAFSLIELKPIYTTWESCPNLLELDELTKIHPHIDAAI